MKRGEFIKSGLALAGISSLYSFVPTSSENEIIAKFHKKDDWDILQSQFLIDKKITYFNNGTMGINPKVVVDELSFQFTELAKSGHYPGNDTMVSLRTKLGNVFGVDKSTIAITKNVTEGVNIACWGIDLKKDDEVIMTKHEHVGGCTSWIYRSQKEGIVIKTFDLGKTAEETFENLKKAITPKTRVIAIPHIPCTIGQILPIKAICDWARSKNILTVIDGAHPLGMIRINVADLGCDYYTGCLHKWLLGPIGMGFIYIRPTLLSSTNIFNIGAYSVGKYDMTTVPPSMDKLVEETQRYSAGTFCGPSYLAAIKAIDWYEEIGIDKIESRVKFLSNYTHEQLEKYKKEIEILTPKEEISRGAQTTFRFLNKKSEDFVNYAKTEKFILRNVHEANLNGVRISTHYYNSTNQINNLMLLIDKFLKK